MSPIARDQLQGDDDIMTIEVENLRKTIQGKNHYKYTLSNEAFTMISEVITFTGKTFSYTLQPIDQLTTKKNLSL